MKNLFSIDNFGFDKESGRKRIRDRGIHWQEKYGDKSSNLKKKFDKTIGRGSYYRFEGKDYTTNSDYFIVIGPSIDRAGEKSFFAGIKKMPPLYKRRTVYAPSGKYFPTIMSAISYASQKWGLPYPQDAIPYDKGSLNGVDIPKRLKG
jgi:hypothetical protein